MPAPAISSTKPEPKSAAYGHVCVDCAKAKVKCFPREEGGCVRCHRRGKPCTPATPARRLGAKRASSAASPARSSRLEGKLDHLVDLIRSQQAAHDATVATHSSHGGSVTQSPAQQQDQHLTAHVPPRHSPQGHTVYSPHQQQQQQQLLHQQQHQHQNVSLVTPAATTVVSSDSPLGFTKDDDDLTFMTPDQAQQCLNIFQSGYLKYLPFVHFPEGTDPAQLQRDRPFLWLTIQAICARPPSRQLLFGDLIREVLARQYMIKGERSMDLLLGCLAFLTWAQLFNRGRPTMTMLSHIARALTYDLRINKDLPDEATISSVYTKHLGIIRPEPSHEVRRALLTCYITSSVTTSFGRIAPLSWSMSMEEAAQHLRESPDSPNDEILVAIASARRIIDETSLLNKLQIDDPVGFGSFTAHIPELKNALQAEREKLPLELRDNRVLASYFGQVEICIYELVMLMPSTADSSTMSTTTHPRAKRAAPSTSAGSAVPVTGQRHHERSNPATTAATTINSMLFSARSNTRRLGYLTCCLDTTKQYLDNLLSLDANDFLYMTFSVMVQAFYSLQTLNRLTLVEGVPGWERSEVREVADGLDYMSRVEAKLRQAGELLDGESRRINSSTAGGGNTRGRGEGDDAQEASSFTNAAELLRKMAELWAMALNAKPVSKKSGDSRLAIDFSIVDFGSLGKRVDKGGGGGGGGEIGAAPSNAPDAARGGAGSFDTILNHHDRNGDVPMASGGMSTQMPTVTTAANGLPLYNHQQQQQHQNTYATTGPAVMPEGSVMFGGMGDQLMYSSMPDYGWMSDMLGYWEI